MTYFWWNIDYVSILEFWFRICMIFSRNSQKNIIFWQKKNEQNVVVTSIVLTLLQITNSKTLISFPEGTLLNSKYFFQHSFQKWPPKKYVFLIVKTWHSIWFDVWKTFFKHICKAMLPKQTRDISFFTAHANTSSDSPEQTFC